MKSSAPVPTHTTNRLLRGVALFQLALAMVRLVIERGSWPSVSMMIVGALLMIFCAKEAVNDERVEHLKLKAAKAGLLFGTLGVMLLQVFGLVAGLTPPSSDQPGGVVPFSAFDVLLVIMVITLGCYYFWRWQDGRATKVD